MVGYKSIVFKKALVMICELLNGKMPGKSKGVSLENATHEAIATIESQSNIN